MNLQNSEPDHSEFDLIIIGHGLQSALLLAQAVSKGLKTAVIAYNDLNEGFDQSPIVHLDPISNQNSFLVQSSGDLIKSLKKSFAHLFIQSNSIYYGKIIFMQILIVKLLRVFARKKIIYQSQNPGFRLPSLSYISYRFSSARMSLSLFKESINKGASVYQHAKIEFTGFDNNRNYKMIVTDTKNNQTINIRTKNILSFYMNFQLKYIQLKQLAEKNLVYYYFTYPAAKIDLKKNLIYKARNENFNIIPWFDMVYFEYSNQAPGLLTFDFLMNHLSNKFPDILIDKSLVLSFGSYKTTDYLQNKNKIQLVYIKDKEQINFRYKPLNQWFGYSNNICNSIIKKIKKGKIGCSTIGETVFSGSDLPNTTDSLRIMEYCDQKYDESKQILNSPVYFKKLFYRYGTEVEKITEKAYQYWNETKNSSYSWIKAELSYSVEFEYCKSIDDYINYRSDLWMEGKTLNRNELEKVFLEIIKEDKNCE